MSCSNRSFEPLVVAVFVALATAVGVGLLSSCGYDGIPPTNILDTGGGGGGGPDASITSINPTTTNVGSVLQIIGTGFASGDLVQFSGETLNSTPNSVAASLIDVTITEDACRGVVSVVRGTRTFPGPVLSVVPRMNFVSWPGSVASGGTITARGNGFDRSVGQTTIRVGTTLTADATVTFASGDNSAVANFGAGVLPVGTFPVLVRVQGVLDSNAISCTFSP